MLPSYNQRKYRWTKQQVEELATSLLRDLPIPPIYAFRNENGQLEILDGQQRVMSLYFYYIGRFFADTQQNVFDYRELDIDHTSNFEEALAKKYDIVPTKFYMIFGKEKCDITYATLPKDIKRKVEHRSAVQGSRHRQHHLRFDVPLRTGAGTLLRPRRFHGDL